ncbi:hypothetical protein J2X07_000276 [Fictibacillus barbaricus]|uniref:Uncharacterized protein n=1 Tax=Fictibacillus barbaricus TaxID=182136 RepID=A0ABU1TVS9_9BACL|nr:hypothetical protein [Fictibacillus barbaricus]
MARKWLLFLFGLFIFLFALLLATPVFGISKLYN